MEDYLKRIANQPLASATTPLSSTSPGRSSKPTQPQTGGIFPTSNRIIQQAANPTGSQRSARASAGTTRSIAQGAVTIMLDASKVDESKMLKLGRALEPFSESLKTFINNLGDLEANRAENITKIAGVGAIMRGLSDIDKLNPKKASNNLVTISGGLRTFIDEISSIDKRKAEKIKPISYVGDILKNISVVLNIKPGQVIVSKVFLPILGNAIKSFADRVSEINAKKTEDGLRVVPKMGMGLLAFTGSIALAAVAMTAVALDPLKFVGLFTIMAATGVAFHYIGQNDKTINKGSLAVAGMGLGLLVFAGGLSMASQSMPPVADILPLALALTAFGGVYYLAGKFAPEIGLGALAMGAAGLATWLISKPIETISSVINQNPSVLWQLPVMLTGIGAAFALAGTGPIPIFIAAGALALGAAGGALWVLGKGLSTMMSMPTITKEKAEGIESGIRAVVTGFGKSFSDLSLKESLTLPLKIPMVGLMGLTLAGLATGISSYQSKAGGFGPKDTENIKNTISGLSEAFATAGSTQGMSKLFGFNVGSNDVERGIESTMRMGKNLQNLADGVLAWKKMPLTPADIQQVSDNVSRVLNVIPGIFAGIGQADAGSVNKVSFLGLSFESPFAKGNTERGISATMEMGENLKGLADGVLAWKDGGKAGFKSSDLPGIVSNIQNILGTIPGSFAALGAADRETAGIFPWSDGDIENGIELAKDLGPSLQSIASLLDSVKTGNISKATTDISNNIPLLLGSYASALNDFGNKLEVDPEDILEQITDITETFSEVSDSAGKINSSLTTLGDLATPLDKVAKSLMEVNKAMKAQLDLLDNNNKAKLDMYSKYYMSISDVAKSTPAVLKQNLDAVLKSGYSPEAMNAVYATKQVQVTNQITQPPKVKVEAPKIDMSAQEKVNNQILEALTAIAKIMAQNNTLTAQNAKAIEELGHILQGGIKVKDSAFG